MENYTDNENINNFIRFVMEKIMNLWIAKNRNGAIYLFSEEPYSAEGEFYGNSCQGIEVDESLIHGNIDYGPPKKVTLLIDE